MRSNTVSYNAMSACGLCQGGSASDFSQWMSNCSTVDYTNFPSALPDGVKVPKWAFVNVSSSGTFNLAAVEAGKQMRPLQMHGTNSASQHPTSTPAGRPSRSSRPSSSPSSSSCSARAPSSSTGGAGGGATRRSATPRHPNLRSRPRSRRSASSARGRRRASGARAAGASCRA